ncbi:hypothetical protein [Allochromatium vinosum]|uniref:Uncharacterized protein n=1 Tax=Allochromatium vinosum (strain ATCC 17899 / DSM 180 / NBRC 103801 / NCIMB 10441 / D) TaxID=572477 RepID=D3RNF0_ALLVD|nr:hypothetical protein [Allochromatium vinosum]ADC63315.1 hypothetical protein Alvin_2399 [Allochromatium vinosum DSM 180]
MEYAVYAAAVAALILGLLLYRRWKRSKRVNRRLGNQSDDLGREFSSSAVYEVRDGEVVRCMEFYFSRPRKPEKER